MTKPIHFVATDSAPAAIGPYSQAVVAGGLVFCSGQLPMVPGSGEVLTGDIGVQTTQALNNLDAVLIAAGASRDCVVKTTVYLARMSDFAAMNQAYAVFFGSHKPARAAIEAAALPKGVGVEIEATAVLP